MQNQIKCFDFYSFILMSVTKVKIIKFTILNKTSVEIC